MSQAKNEIKQWGILGTSFISGVMAEAIRQDGQSRIYAVAGRSPEPRELLAAQYDIPVQHDNYDALIADPKVDIIYIALPNHLHHEYVIKAAKAGKAILCEKSLSVDMEKTEAALAAVDQHGIFFAEGLMYLNHPFTAKILEVIKAGKIGELRSIQGQYTAAISQFVNPDSKGALYNLGCYPVSLLHLIIQQCGGNESAENYTLSAMGRRGLDGNICETQANFRFGNGVMAQLHTAEDYGLHAEFTVLGSTGSLQVTTNPWLPATQNQLTITQYEQQSEVVEVTADGDGFLYQVRAVLNALENGDAELTRPAAGPEDSRQIMKLLTDWEDAVIA
ncbi:Gfo/Idh/MocA family protein [Photobacterium lutimaris]|uniref:Gfo/Idh/MocA family oxidoreductase n=1 Tax=Photobacterium lutimaris TaxID=388278 RepID=A0A2T3J2K6_9GAMM|nr:Gfo/Idh/MocA family oxidoreductase [Photobacterium lutimaris]PSU35529.1 gfo/Idh/MocA family oxidoreductase [Photobacterium lutimaris]TDR78580.1 putative dehydrogenase [Photobacterium lutimaris]